MTDFSTMLKYIEDINVDEELDRKLRKILSTCFTKDPQFKTQRFYNYLPKHRWFLEIDGEIVAHLAAHEMEFEVDGVKSRFLGIAEVCVMPEYRGRKLVSMMLAKAESVNPEIKYSILLGNPDVYRSSGYKKIYNVFFPKVSDQPNDHAMAKCLGDDPWPEGNVIINYLNF